METTKSKIEEPVDAELITISAEDFPDPVNVEEEKTRWWRKHKLLLILVAVLASVVIIAAVTAGIVFTGKGRIFYLSAHSW